MVTFQPFGAGHNSRVEAGLRVIKRTSKTAGFNNPAGRALVYSRGFAVNRYALTNRSRDPALALAHPTVHVDLLEPVDAFNISVPLR
jgi:hypothetical protein